MSKVQLHLGECVSTMQTMEANSIDTIITDPPYLINFMSKEFDSQHKALEGANEGQKMQAWHTLWAKEALRVAKPGSYILAFGGSRTSHRLACALEDAGWMLVDEIIWHYSTGFPKGANIALNIQKHIQGHPQGSSDPTSPNHGKFKGGCSDENEVGQGFGAGPGQFMEEQSASKREITEPLARPWRGFNTALKPAHEPILVAMKPCDGTYSNNALQYGVAGFNIDACRIGTTKDVPASPSRTKGNALSGSVDGSLRHETGEESGHNPNVGRWPANVIFEHHESCHVVGTQVVKGDNRKSNEGSRPSGFAQPGADKGSEKPNGTLHGDAEVEVWECHEDCPVKILNAQSGIKQSGKSKSVHAAYDGKSNTGILRGVHLPVTSTAIKVVPLDFSIVQSHQNVNAAQATITSLSSQYQLWNIFAS